jgi:hypothetical protein
MSDIVQFKKDIDYLVHNKIIELSKDYFESGLVIPDQSFYGKLTDILEENLYNTYGTLIEIDDPNRYNFNNISGKAAINTVLEALQNSSYIDNYQSALNVYYGLPIAPQNCKVLGLYESYDYIINHINGNNINLIIKEGSTLHPFIQIGTRLRVDRTNEELVVVSVPSNEDRINGLITVEDAYKGTLSIVEGDVVNIKLINKYQIKSITQEYDYVDAAVYIYSNESADKLQHIINIIQDMTDNKEYPEILIYGTSEFSNNYDGIYHITSVIESI